jgi:hypothetical protein
LKKTKKLEAKKGESEEREYLQRKAVTPNGNSKCPGEGQKEHLVLRTTLLVDYCLFPLDS